jgi:uncharacterized protein YcbK (DUF882 family)
LHVRLNIAHRVLSYLTAPRSGCHTLLSFGLAVAVLVFGCDSLQNAVAEGDTRTISLHHVHTGEDLTITYKRNGRYDAEALKKINHILRDWRKNEEVAQDPLLIDLVWEVQREVGATQPVHIICGYRAPQTNAMLRRKSGGVAQFSQHMLGKAMDFFIPGVPLEKLREIGLRLQRGGIGFYPTSGSPFVHLDVGSVRHWPEISREELARIFPDGRTVHIPSDGRPMAGYALAKAEIERRGNHPSSVSLAAARNAGVVTAQNESSTPFNPLAKLFGFGRQQEPDVHTTAAITPAAKPQPAAKPAPAAKPVATAKAQPKTPEPVKVAAALPPKSPAFSAISIPWPDQAAPIPMMPERALAYAPLPGPEMNTRPAAPQHAIESRPLAAPKTTAVKPASIPAYIPRETSIVVKQDEGKPAIVHARRVQNGEPFNDPWLRALILAPSLSYAMTAVPVGAEDYRGLAVFMRKPSYTVAMTFSADPNQGLRADRFTGHAVVFVETTSFISRTAMLQ